MRVRTYAGELRSMKTSVRLSDREREAAVHALDLLECVQSYFQSKSNDGLVRVLEAIREMEAPR